jgi:hypothetical protein
MRTTALPKRTTALPDRTTLLPDRTTALRRLAAAGLAIVIVVGSSVLWIGVPVGGAWVAGRVTSDPVTAFLLALVTIPTAMAGVGWVLSRASARYEAIRGHEPVAPGPPSWRASLGEERAGLRRRKGGRRLIDVAMTISASAALVLLAFWFFFFAELRLSPFP